MNQVLKDLVVQVEALKTQVAEVKWEKMRDNEAEDWGHRCEI